MYFNPRAPQGARQATTNPTPGASGFQSTRSARSATACTDTMLTCITISIHALRKERDVDVTNANLTSIISIHALRKERDLCARTSFAPFTHFNPRAPQGARHEQSAYVKELEAFQSTRSARSATLFVVICHYKNLISIHALRKERDSPTWF